MNQTQAALRALPSDLVTKLCRSKVTRLSLKQIHVLEPKNHNALVIPALFLHQELPIRLSHALNMLNSNLLPFNMSEMPTFQHIARSYLEDISLITQMPKPSTPQLEEEFTALLRNLEQRHKVKMLTISQGFKEFMNSVAAAQGAGTDAAEIGHCGLHFNRDTNRWTVDPQTDRDIQTFFNRFYTINLGTRLLIGEQLALHDRGLNLVQRVHPLSISKRAIQDAQRVCSAHYGQPAPSVLIQTPNPDISATYVEEFLHRNIFELLKNAMRATCETHLQEGAPVSLSMTAPTGPATGSKLPPITLTVVDGEEDVTIKIADQGGGLALSELDKVWSYVHFANSTAAASVSRSQKEGGVSAGTVAFMGGLGSEVKDYLDLPLSGSGHGLPLARLIAKYFGGDLSLYSMEGHGTDSYLSLYRDVDHLENFPEVDEEMLAEVDVFVNELLDECVGAEESSVVSGLRLKAPLPTPVTSLPSSMVLGLRQSQGQANAYSSTSTGSSTSSTSSTSSSNNSNIKSANMPLDIGSITPRSGTTSPAL
ncbi:mitochondrial branched-chain alpha-ketoacid dehydrogenase kinase-domain-containing protein [Gamsiella multidivaricata]|uniref:mitochondrial branched-chain alpha-ketoacid dehydrogenase kinase-domain-containing protein n=1 Tax=Gamsiella multidivaricata TaxID=101098 RepID=UPI00221F3746|nr:mitochondrial branched-chain alpha-ketoacid dehydrogenase kinase-domain-containing protein [Gamsiella multidivaricata]KAI7821356.1 mitochondrial branched-chain alpha-ketoacid dehydrogenase kinase-domain-containing protein [Gamsiella multidivaricata]